MQRGGGSVALADWDEVEVVEPVVFVVGVVDVVLITFEFGVKLETTAMMPFDLMTATCISNLMTGRWIGDHRNCILLQLSRQKGTFRNPPMLVQCLMSSPVIKVNEYASDRVETM